MIATVPYTPIHMEFCDFHEAFADQAGREDPNMLAASREAWSFIDEDSGEVIAIVGVIETHENCGYVWSYMSKSAGRHMTRITRFMVRWLDTLGMVRIEATVLKNFKAAHRWMRLLSFKRETTRPMKRWDGINDYHLYSRVRG